MEHWNTDFLNAPGVKEKLKENSKRLEEAITAAVKNFFINHNLNCITVEYDFEGDDIEGWEVMELKTVNGAVLDHEELLVTVSAGGEIGDDDYTVEDLCKAFLRIHVLDKITNWDTCFKSTFVIYSFNNIEVSTRLLIYGPPVESRIPF